MTTLDTVAHVAAHARNQHLPKRIKQLVVSAVRTGLALPDDELDLFVDWCRSLDDVVLAGHAPGPAGYLEASGRLLTGEVVQITVETSGDALRASGLAGVLVLGEVEQYARRRTAVPA
ncbi:hypothetical protein [Amycolatopsis sp. NPDC051128]|uniref:hypothetical protein n=1 Tax=Amycolatopsis sp. NPDC051128 TaxID=3155412 RepID=UPI0034186D40